LPLLVPLKFSTLLLPGVVEVVVLIPRALEVAVLGVIALLPVCLLVLVLRTQLLLARVVMAQHQDYLMAAMELPLRLTAFQQVAVEVAERLIVGLPLVPVVPVVVALIRVVALA
jgi:hypothetical protein